MCFFNLNFIFNAIDSTAIQYTFSTIPQVVSAVYAISSAFLLHKLTLLSNEDVEAQKTESRVRSASINVPENTINSHFEDISLESKIPLPETGFSKSKDEKISDFLGYLAKYREDVREIKKEIKKIFITVSKCFVTLFLLNVLSVLFSNLLDGNSISKVLLIIFNFSMLAVYIYYQWLLIKKTFLGKEFE
ncbi:hypothetical protein HOH45_05125 [bacterium]|jgi:hypothetical protein|nr:hypothetical protein [bacterium]